jgi:hypothetical protein
VRANRISRDKAPRRMLMGNRLKPVSTVGLPAAPRGFRYQHRQRR